METNVLIAISFPTLLLLIFLGTMIIVMRNDKKANEQFIYELQDKIVDLDYKLLHSYARFNKQKRELVTLRNQYGLLQQGVLNKLTIIQKSILENSHVHIPVAAPASDRDKDRTIIQQAEQIERLREYRAILAAGCREKDKRIEVLSSELNQKRVESIANTIEIGEQIRKYNSLEDKNDKLRQELAYFKQLSADYEKRIGLGINE